MLGAIGFRRPDRWTGAGLVGTAEGLALLPFLPKEAFPLSVLLTVSIAAACWVCGRAERALGRHDDPHIVLDEVVGFWTAAALLPATPAALGAAFVLFRIFDTLKPPPCRWLERLPGGAGVVADDVGAGLLTNLILQSVVYLRPALLS